MNCGNLLTVGVPVDGTEIPVPMEGLSEGEDDVTAEPRGFKRAFKEEGESQGNLSSGMSLDEVEQHDWEKQSRALLRRHVPCVIMKGTNSTRALNVASIQDLTGEYYVWEEPKA